MTWLKRIRGALGMALTWAVVWAIGGVMIGIASNVFPSLPWKSFFDVFDAPLTMLAVPGFVAGALFSVVLGTAGRRRKFEELSLPRFAAWGAVGGLLLSLVPTVLVAARLATGDGLHTLWQVTSAISGPFVVLSAISATLSLLLARRAKKRQLDQYPALAETGFLRALDRGSLPGAAESLDDRGKHHTREVR